MGGPDVDEVRARVAAGHAAVAEGRYDEAVAVFTDALAALGPLLGEEHPEVVELADDLEAAREMGEVSRWGAEVGFRHFARGVPRDPDDA